MPLCRPVFPGSFREESNVESFESGLLGGTKYLWGTTFSGWEREHLPCLVEIDNRYGRDTGFFKMSRTTRTITSSSSVGMIRIAMRLLLGTN